jgi:hypothetical protein
MTFRLPVPLAGRYRVAALLARGPAFGVTSVSVDGVPAGSPFDAYAPQADAPATVELGAVPLSAGAGASAGLHEIALRVVRRNEQSGGLNIGIDSFVLHEAPDFVDEYMVIGPFPMRSPDDMDTDFGPESALSMSQALPGAQGQVAWEPMGTDQRGYLDLAAALSPATDVIAYALCYVHSPVERDALLLVGSDDRLKVWLNGLTVHRSMAVRGASPDQDKVPVHLRAGWNALLAKVGQGTGGWGLYTRLDDPDYTYRYTIHPPDRPADR